MIRAFENEKRIGTAVVLKEGRILQVYPTKQTFENETEWKATFPSAEFQTEAPKQSMTEAQKQEKRKKVRLSKLERQIQNSLSWPRSSDTPLQKIVRQLYFQLGIDDSLVVYETLGLWRQRRIDSNLYVYVPSLKKMLSIFFERRTGYVVFDHQLRFNFPVDGLLFFYKPTWESSFHQVEPLFQQLHENQKVVVQIPRLYRSKADTELQQKLIEKGFYILFYWARKNPWRSHLQQLQSIPNCKSVILETYNNKLTIYPSWNSISNSREFYWVSPLQVDMNTWFEQN